MQEVVNANAPQQICHSIIYMLQRQKPSEKSDHAFHLKDGLPLALNGLHSIIIITINHYLQPSEMQHDSLFTKKPTLGKYLK